MTNTPKATPDPAPPPPTSPPPTPATPYVASGRVMYVLTERDRGYAAGEAEDAAARKRNTRGQKWQASLSALKGDTEYHRGLGQGRVDAARGLPYHDERLGGAYNHGYHRGYTDYERDVRGGLKIKPEYLQPIETYPTGEAPTFTPPPPKPRAPRKPKAPAAKPAAPPPAPRSAPIPQDDFIASDADILEDLRLEREDERAAAPAPARAPTMLFPEYLLPDLDRVYTSLYGTRLNHPVVFTSVNEGRRTRITDDTPSMHGSHLLGHEGDYALAVEYRPATEDEITAHAALTTARRARARAIDAAREAVRQALLADGHSTDGAYHYTANLLTPDVDPNEYPPGRMRDALAAYAALTR